MGTTGFVLVLTTLPSARDAEPIGRAIVTEGLAACVNVLAPMRSIYRWKGAVEVADEQQVVIKTTAANVDALERRLRELHPYEIPEFVVVDLAGGTDAYLSWLAAACSP